MKKNEATFIDPDQFRGVMSCFATGITVVTTRLGDEISGLTVNAFCPLSLEPPLILICIQKETNNHDFILKSGKFAVNILHKDQEPVARRFAMPELSGQERFDGLEHSVQKTGAPILSDALGWLDCQLKTRHDGGDHTIFIGEVLALNVSTRLDPLLFYRSDYHRFSSPG